LVIRALSYNIHGCVDAKRRVRPLRVYDIIKQLNADIVALQEVDGETALRANSNQAAIIGEKLNQNYVYYPTDETGLRAFGLSVISRFKIADAHFGWLPSLYPRLNMRKRGALRATLCTPGGIIHVINAHLSVYKLESYKQIKALMAGSWFADIGPGDPVILCGDFNAGPSSLVYKTATRNLVDVQKALDNGHKPKPTFHSRSTYWRIDHILVSDHFTPLNVDVGRDKEIRQASDHLPVTAELALSASRLMAKRHPGFACIPVAQYGQAVDPDI
jgi:endonuclease/exonuclease/phosphatase family metal-dependent hydrolase